MMHIWLIWKNGCGLLFHDLSTLNCHWNLCCWLQLSLFFDVMLPMCPGVNARDFRSGARRGTYGKDVAAGDIKTMRAARTILWDDLHKYKIKACELNILVVLWTHRIKGFWNDVFWSFIRKNKNYLSWECFLLLNILPGSTSGPDSKYVKRICIISI